MLPGPLGNLSSRVGTIDRKSARNEMNIRMTEDVILPALNLTVTGNVSKLITLLKARISEFKVKDKSENISTIEYVCFFKVFHEGVIKIAKANIGANRDR